MAIIWADGLPLHLVGNHDGKFWADGLPLDTIFVAGSILAGLIYIDPVPDVVVGGVGVSNASIIIDTLPNLSIQGVRVQDSDINIDPVPDVVVVGGILSDGSLNIDPVVTTDIEANAEADVNFSSVLEANVDMLAEPDADQAAVKETNVDMLVSALREILTSDFIYYASTDNKRLSVPSSSGDLIVNTINAYYRDSEIGVIRLEEGFGPLFDINKTFKSNYYDLGRDLVKRSFSQFETTLADFVPSLIIIDSKPAYYVHDIDGIVNDRHFIVDGVLGIVNTQTAVEVLGTEDAGARLTQIAVELLISPSSSTFLTQLAIEVLKLANLLAVKQVAVEAIHQGDISDLYVKQIAIEMLITSPKKTRLTQVAVETLKGAVVNQPARLTQVAVETLRERTEGSLARMLVQQNAIEFMVVSDSNLRVKQDAIEAVHDGQGKLRTKQVAIEAVHDGQGKLRTKQVAIEVLVKKEFDPTVASLINNPKHFV